MKFSVCAKAYLLLCQRDLFISGDFDRVGLLFTRGIYDYQRDLFSVVTYQWRVFHSLVFRYTETVSELQQQQLLIYVFHFEMEFVLDMHPVFCDYKQIVMSGGIFHYTHELILN